MSSDNVTTITTDQPVVTLINVFTVEPENQQDLLERWQRATDEVMRRFPGFVSANIHRSFDGTKIINYAQWRSREAFQTMLSDPAAAPHFAELRALAHSEPMLCEVVSVHHPASD